MSNYLAEVMTITPVLKDGDSILQELEEMGVDPDDLMANYEAIKTKIKAQEEELELSEEEHKFLAGLYLAVGNTVI